MNLNEIAKVIEGVLFVAGEGVDIDEFKTRFGMNDREFNKCLDILKEKYNETSGINIIQFKSKIQFCSNPSIVENITEILNPIRERSLTKAALETVAIIAYKQPITRFEIESIRGVNCDYAVQLLQSNNLIEVVGRKDTVGKPLLFGTTENFLKRFELKSLDELPNYNELLDRIRVIHSEGDSLYREFTIPEEEQSNEADLQQNSKINLNENKEEAVMEDGNKISSDENEKMVENQQIKNINKNKNKTKIISDAIDEIATKTDENLSLQDENKAV